MKSAIIVNDVCGRSTKLKKLLNGLKGHCAATVIHVNKSTVLGDLSAFDKLVVCGGDGTLHNVINHNVARGAQVFYLPCGTLNESCQRAKNCTQLSELGKANDEYFSYVCAAGIFTPLGYAVADKKKRLWKKWAYVGKILSEYKVHRIAADFELNGAAHSGEYALLMAIDSPQCFGFKFNKCFCPDDGKLHFLAIKSPRHNGILGATELFFPLFRTFFVGFKGAFRSKSIIFEPCERMTLHLNQAVPFDMDGEKTTLGGHVEICVEKCRYSLKVIDRNDFAKVISSL